MEHICTLSCEQGFAIVSILTAFSMTISTIVLAITGVLEGGGGDLAVSALSPPKDKGALEKWLNKLVDTIKRLAGKAVEALPAIVGSVVGAILRFLGKTIGFASEQPRALIVCVAELIGV